MRSWYLELPADFDDYCWEVEAKGWFSGARIIASDIRYSINFYDQARLSQQIQDEVPAGQIFFEPNLVVIRAVTRTNMENAAEELVLSGRVSSLLAET